jgi:hypothetical protein
MQFESTIPRPLGLGCFFALHLDQPATSPRGAGIAELTSAKN